ncbi:MAG: helix-turn-helix domain-containing protein [Dehalococcoidia bacterium]|nr:MAG: helix-turn-helix domain-containing protein [Dehalococcoidia bacterium]
MNTNTQGTGMLTVTEASHILHVHKNTLRRWTEQGILKTYRIGNRRDRRFRPEDIALLLLGESESVTIGETK